MLRDQLLYCLYCFSVFGNNSYITGKEKLCYSQVDPTNTLVEVNPPNHLVFCDFNPWMDGHLLAEGCFNGQVRTLCCLIFMNGQFVPPFVVS